MLQTEIEFLEDQIRILRGLVNNLIHDAAQKELIVDYNLYVRAVVESRKFCISVYEKFPREIRDMIYSCLLGRRESRVCEFPPAGAGKSHVHPTLQNLFSCLYSTTQPEKYVQGGKALCFEMKQELGELYYKSSCFHFEHNPKAINRTEALSQFRIVDQWNLGVFPAAFISNVNMKICFTTSHFDGLDMKKVRQNAGQMEDPWEIRQCEIESVYGRPRIEYLVTLNSLFGFRPGTSLTIECLLKDDKNVGPFDKQEWMCRSVVPFIFPTLLRLKATGYNVRIKLLGKGFGLKAKSFISELDVETFDDLQKSFWKVRVFTLTLKYRTDGPLQHQEAERERLSESYLGIWF